MMILPLSHQVAVIANSSYVLHINIQGIGKVFTKPALSLLFSDLQPVLTELSQACCFQPGCGLMLPVCLQELAGVQPACIYGEQIAILKPSESLEVLFLEKAEKY